MAVKLYINLLVCMLICLSSAAQRNSETRIVEWNITSAAAINQLEQSGNFDLRNARLLQPGDPARLVYAPRPIELRNITPFLSFSMAWTDVNDDPENTNLQIRFSANGSKWDEWISIEKDGHYEKTKHSFVSTLMELNRNYRFYQLGIRTNLSRKGNMIQGVLLNFFSPGEAIAAPPSPVAQPAHATISFNTNNTQNCNCPQPNFVNRTGWNCPQVSWNVGTTNVTHLIVHHSAGSNTSGNWGAVVLSIWNFHTGTNGFSDIGYNWLIAPDGTLYEGRFKSSTDDVTGAHFCGFNGATMGVCMLGTYTNQTVTEAANNTLIRLLAWKACQRGIDPTASSLHSGSNMNINRISGHRQGCATECPGTTFFNTLPAVRTAVKQFSDNGCTLTSTPDTDAGHGFQLLSNPMRNTAQFRMQLPAPEKVQYRLLHVDGRVIYSSPAEIWSGTVTREIRETLGLSSGTYLLQLQVGNRSFTRKLVKE